MVSSTPKRTTSAIKNESRNLNTTKRAQKNIIALAKAKGDTTALAGKMAAREARKVHYQQRQQYLEQSGDVQYVT